MAFDSKTVISQNIINRYKLRNPNGFDAGEETKLLGYLEDMIEEIFDVQLKTKADVQPGSFAAGSTSVSGLGGPLQ